MSELFNFDAAGRAPITEASAGEIVVFSGMLHPDRTHQPWDLYDPTHMLTSP